MIAAEASEGTGINKEATDMAVTEDSEDANTNKKTFLNVDLKNTLVMAIVALISIVCSFIFVSKISTSLGENDFEVQGVNSISTVGRAGDVQQRDTKVKRENKKGKTDKGKINKADRASAENGNSDDVNNDEEVGGIQDTLMVPLESVVVNLGGVDSNRYLRAQITLGVDNENAQNMINEKGVIIRDMLFSFFSRKTAKVMETEGGLFKLRLEIKGALNKLLGSDDIIKKVYFSDFIVQ